MRWAGIGLAVLLLLPAAAAAVSSHQPARHPCPSHSFAGNLNMDGPIYIDLVKHTSPDGKTVWQVQDTYYGE